jgi:hypothetical protein
MIQNSPTIMKPNITGLNQTGFRASSEPLCFGTFSAFGLRLGSFRGRFFGNDESSSGVAVTLGMVTILQVGFDQDDQDSGAG